MTTADHRQRPAKHVPLWGRVVVIAAVVLTGALVLLVLAGMLLTPAGQGDGAAPQPQSASAPGRST